MPTPTQSTPVQNAIAPVDSDIFKIKTDLPHFDMNLIDFDTIDDSLLANLVYDIESVGIVQRELLMTKIT